MLTPIDDAPPVVTASGTSGVDKQIVAVGSGANTVVYTVPDGRKFVGYASNTSWNQRILLDTARERWRCGLSLQRF